MQRDHMHDVPMEIESTIRCHNSFMTSNSNTTLTIAMTSERGGKERGGNDDGNYVRYLETKMNKLVDEVRILKSKAAHMGGKRGNLRELRITYKWTEDDIDISEQVIKFCSEYLFPRYKFLEKGWIVHDPEKENRFSMFVKKHLPLPDDVVFEEKWDILIAPSIVKKYTDMRCNVNAFVRDTYLSECPICILLLIV